MKRKRHISRSTPSSLLRSGGHPVDAALLLAVDGELPASEAALVNSHFDTCWRCRARKEEIERTIGNIVAYESRFAGAFVKPRSAGTSLFLARLDLLAVELDHSAPSARERIQRVLHGAMSSPMVRAAGIVLTVCSLIYLSLLGKTPTVSASEILHRAASSEADTLPNMRDAVVMQKISVRVAGKSEVRTIYRDLVHGRETQRVDAAGEYDLTAHREFEKASLSWNDPLSPKKYDEWWNSVDGKQDTVTRVSESLIRLDTTAAAGPIAEASLLVRSDDYHPVSEDFRFRDDTRIEVAELSYRVVAFSSLDPGIFEANAPKETVKTSTPATPRIDSWTRPDAFRLAASEIAVATVLHDLGADMGEQISERPGADGSIEVTGVASSRDREDQISKALENIPLTKVRISNLEEPSIEAAANAPETHQSVLSITQTMPPLLEKELNARFSDSETRAQYVNNALALCQDASAHTWALMRLAKSFDEKKVDLLGGNERGRLQRILAAHIVALREELKQLRAQLDLVVRPHPVSARTDAETSSFGDVESADWQGSVEQVHLSEKSTSTLVESLLAGSSASDAGIAEAEEKELSAALLLFQSNIELLDRRVRSFIYRNGGQN